MTTAVETDTFDPTTPVYPRRLDFRDSQGRAWSFTHGSTRQWYRETGRDVTRKRGGVLVDEPETEAVTLDWVDESRLRALVEELSGAYAKIAELQAFIRGFQKVRGQ